MPKVSIIIPVYNKARYLAHTLDAIITQTFQDWELIIVDDGSTDQSLKIIQRYASKEKRIRVIAQTNKGVSAARNVGLDSASGEWIWFVDADDLPDPQFLSHVFSVPYHPLPDLIIGHFEREEKHQMYPVTIKETGYVSAEKMPALFMKYQYANGYFGYLWNKLIRHLLLKERGLRFDEHISLAEDLQFLTSLYRQDIQCYLIPCIALYYTVDVHDALSKRKVDYRAQLEIQLQIKSWIIDERHQAQYLAFFKKIISLYVACIIFHGYTDHLDTISMGKNLLRIDDVTKMLCTDQVEARLFPIVWCLKHRRLHWMQHYLYLYHSLRTFYRKIFKITFAHANKKGV